MNKTKFAIGTLVAALSMSANATFMTATADGGFVVKDAGEWVELDGVTASTGTVIDLNGDGIDILDPTVHAGVRWGGAGKYSSLILEDFAPDIDALDTNYALSALTHNNFSISADFDWLTYASIMGHISFSSAFSGGIAAGFGNSFVVDDFEADAVSQFNINFKETYNMASTDDCSAVDEDGVAGGDSHVFVTGCDDYFDYSIDNPDPLPDSMPFAVPFYIDGAHYALTIFASLDADGSTLLPQGRFWTEENKSTTIYTFARLTEVPEPSMIALFGLGAFALGVARRRKNLVK
jgi:hypothetical protein